MVPARSVQISLDDELLREIDRQPETRELGRSAVIRRAIRLYLRATERNKIDDAYDDAYRNKGDEVFADLGPLLRSQSWPDR